MTVKELREALAEYPDDMPVVVRGYEGGYTDGKTETVRLARNARKDGPWYYGRHASAHEYPKLPATLCLVIGR